MQPDVRSSGSAGLFLRKHGWQRIVPPLSCDRVRAEERPPADHDSTADSRSRITPKTTSAPAAAPSTASESAKQFASLARRTGRPSARARSSRSGRPFSQVELQFFIRPVRGEIAPGVPMPTVGSEVDEDRCVRVDKDDSDCGPEDSCHCVGDELRVCGAENPGSGDCGATESGIGASESGGWGSESGSIRLEAADKAHDRVDRCLVVVLRSRNPFPTQHPPRRIQEGTLDLRAAKVDPNAHGRKHKVWLR